MRTTESFQEAGRKGGQKTAEVHGDKYFVELGRLGAQKRWGDKKKSRGN